MTNPIPPFVDDRGDMYLHARGGGIAILTFVNEDNSPKDVSNSDLFFEVAGFRKPLTPHPSNDNQQVLTIDRGELNAYIGKLSDYIVVDETDPIEKVIIEGKLRVVGWV